MSLKEQRERAGLSRPELAERSGIKARTIEAYEQGKRDINGADLKTLLKLCQALSCRLGDILDDPELIELLKTNGGKKCFM